MNAYSLRKNVIIHVLVVSAMTKHDCRLQRFIADDTICIHLLVKSLTLRVKFTTNFNLFYSKLKKPA